eukprot:TRINITY_DN447_c0_g1_i5.p1 TRINITY_DN447_c0_g1~~TRINITY_DN447_c0_g1_i5.p1  ORF type:complete len:205 (-),score=0.10 TRINITY_DN447_c0_g1_i5:152-766(-)
MNCLLRIIELSDSGQLPSEEDQMDPMWLPSSNYFSSILPMSRISILESFFPQVFFSVNSNPRSQRVYSVTFSPQLIDERLCASHFVLMQVALDGKLVQRNCHIDTAIELIGRQCFAAKIRQSINRWTSVRAQRCETIERSKSLQKMFVIREMILRDAWERVSQVKCESQKVCAYRNRRSKSDGNVHSINKNLRPEGNKGEKILF